jgi:hypothetical protein
MPRVRFEPMILVFERAKTVHALDRAATVIGLAEFLQIKIKSFSRSIQLKNDISAFNRYTCWLSASLIRRQDLDMQKLHPATWHNHAATCCHLPPQISVIFVSIDGGLYDKTNTENSKFMNHSSWCSALEQQVAYKPGNTLQRVSSMRRVCSPLVGPSPLTNRTEEHFIESYIWGNNHCISYKIHLSGGYRGGFVKPANKLREY